MDSADRAQQLEQQQLAQSLSAIPKSEGEGEKYCLGCDEEIPSRRKRARPDASRCIECQQIEDRKNLHYRTCG